MKHLDLVKDGDDIREFLIAMRIDFEEGNREMFDRMSMCEDFVIGRQWDPEDFAYNESKRRFSLTINQILPTVMQVVGQEVQNPRDITIKNLAAKSATKSRLISALTKHSLDEQHALRKRTQMFKNGIDIGRGIIGIDRSFDSDPERGDLEVLQGNSFMFLPDPGCMTYDYNARANGARGLISDEWIPKELVHGWWPDRQDDLGRTSYEMSKADSIIPMWVRSLYASVFSSGRQFEVNTDYRTRPNMQGQTDEQRESHLWKHNYRASKYWWKKWKVGALLKRLDKPEQYMILLDKKAIKTAKDMLEAKPETPAVLFEKDREGKPLLVPVLNKAIMVGNVLLDAWEDPFDGIHEYPWVRYSPYHMDGHEFGMVDNLIGPQTTLNASWSMGMNIVKQLCNSGYTVGEAHKVWVDWLEANGGNDGVVIPKNRFGGEVEKIPPNPYPVAMDAMAERSTQHIAEIANIRREMPAFDGKDMSGRAILAKQTASMTGSALQFANYDYTTELFGGMVAKHIVQGGLYTEDEIKLLVDENDLVDQQLYDEAHTLVMASVGAVKQPVPPDPDITSQLDFDDQKNQLEMYADHKELYRKVMEYVGEEARDLAIDMLLDELPKMRFGKMAAKVALSDRAATYRERKNAEVFDLNAMLVQSGYEPIPREIMVKTSDVPYMDEIIAMQQGEGLVQPQTQGV